MEDWILYGCVEDTGTKKAAFRFLKAEHGLFGKGNRSFVGSTSMSMGGTGKSAREQHSSPEIQGNYFIRLQTASA